MSKYIVAMTYESKSRSSMVIVGMVEATNLAMAAQIAGEQVDKYTDAQAEPPLIDIVGVMELAWYQHTHILEGQLMAYQSKLADDILMFTE